MKQLLIFAGLSTTILFSACKRERYYDLTAGEYINLEKDKKTGLMVNSKTQEPVYIYVDTKTHDTIYGGTGTVINGHVVKTSDGKYKYDADYKNKVDGDEVKIKEDDKKIKIEDGDKKVKKDD